MDHAAADPVGPTEQGRGSDQVAGGERFADRRGRDTQSVHHDGRHVFDSKGLRPCPQQRNVAGARAAETKVIADQDPASAQAAHENVIDEGHRRQRGEFGVEASHDQAPHAQRREVLGLCAHGGKSRTCRS